MEMNPIIAHEWRTRWRGLKAPGLVLALCVPLALAVVAQYSDASPRTGDNFSAQSARLGRELFTTLGWMQTLAWMLLAPALTSTSIAGEREHGLLESLQLSRLSPRQIVEGKFGAAIAFLLLMSIATLPFSAICFLMGGVSPDELVLVTALQFLTALASSALGLAWSAWTRRASTAMRASFITVCLWGIGSYIAASLSGVLSTLNNAWGTLVAPALQLFGATNPIAAVVSIASPWYTRAPLAAGTLAGWQLCVLFLMLLTPLCLIIAAPAVRKPFDEPRGVVAKARVVRGESTPSKRVHFETRVAPTQWWEIPGTRWIRFKNPVLNREVRSKFRLRHVPLWVILFETLLGIGVAGFYWQAMKWALTEPTTRPIIWWVLSYIALLIILVAAPLMGAAAFTRERESGTYQSLMLSTLSANQILAGKIGAPLVACFTFSVPLWPLMLLCLRLDAGADSSSFFDSKGVTPVQAALTFLVLATTAWCYCALGAVLSWFCRRTSVAVGWALASMLGLNLFFPLLLPLLSDSLGELVQFMNPVVVLSRVVDSTPGRGVEAVTGAFMGSLLLFGTGAALWLYLAGAMRTRGRD